MRLIESNEARRHEIGKLSRQAMRRMLLEVHDVLWPREDPTLCLLWSERTAEKIAAVIERAAHTEEEERP
jgi:hypothetical protein